MSVRYKPYAEYKSSDVEWLDDIPKHWNVCPLGFKTCVKARLGWKGLKADEYVDEGYVFLATPNIKDAEIDFENVNYISHDRYIESPEIMLQIGDVLVTKDGSTTGTTNVVKALPAPATVNSSIAVIRCGGELDGEFLAFQFKADILQNTINRMRGGMGVPHLFQADLRKFCIITPSLPEQRAIASFLDRETGKIDGLIGKQKRMIKLLKEKRQAVISHAVSARKNDKQAKLAFFANLLPGYAFKSDDFVTEPTSTKLLRGINVGVGRTKWDEAVYFEDDTTVNAFRLKAGDLVLGMDRPWIKEGARVAMISDEDLPCLLVQRVARLRAVNGLQQDYLRLQMQSERFQNYVETDLTGVSVPHLSPDQIMGFRIPVLTDAEQAERVGRVRRMEEKFDHLTAKAERAIELMRERRTALISAAVTGKIDVRGSGCGKNAARTRLNPPE